MDGDDYLTLAAIGFFMIMLVGFVIFLVRDAKNNDLIAKTRVVCVTEGYTDVQQIGGELFCTNTEYFPVEALP